MCPISLYISKPGPLPTTFAAHVKAANVICKCCGRLLIAHSKSTEQPQHLKYLMMLRNTTLWRRRALSTINPSSPAAEQVPRAVVIGR